MGVGVAVGVSTGSGQDLSEYQVRRRAHQIWACPGFDLLPSWNRLQKPHLHLVSTDKSKPVVVGELTKIGALIIFMASSSLQVLNIYLCDLGVITGDKSEQRSGREEDAGREQR